MRLSQVARKFNVSTITIVNYLNQKGNTVDPNPNTKLTPPQLELIMQEFSRSAKEKEKALEAREKIGSTTKPSTPAPKAVATPTKPTAPKEKESSPAKTALPSTPLTTGFRIIGSIEMPTKERKNKFTPVTSSDQPSKPKASFQKSAPTKGKPAAKPFPSRFPGHKPKRPTSSGPAQKKRF